VIYLHSSLNASSAASSPKGRLRRRRKLRATRARRHRWAIWFDRRADKHGDGSLAKMAASKCLRKRALRQPSARSEKKSETRRFRPAPKAARRRRSSRFAQSGSGSRLSDSARSGHGSGGVMQGLNPEADPGSGSEGGSHDWRRAGHFRGFGASAVNPSRNGFVNQPGSCSSRLGNSLFALVPARLMFTKAAAS